MTQILFVQGAGENVYEQWDDKLVDSLRRELGAGYEVKYPRMPNEADPKFAVWAPAIEKEIATLDDGAIVVGHSVGATILINALAECAPTVRLGAIVLIAAPFIGRGGWESDDITPREDLGARLPKGVPVLLFHGESDETAPLAHVRLTATAIPQARVMELAGRDHQLDNDLSEVAREIHKLEERHSFRSQSHY